MNLVKVSPDNECSPVLEQLQVGAEQHEEADNFRRLTMNLVK